MGWQLGGGQQQWLPPRLLWHDGHRHAPLSLSPLPLISPYKLRSPCGTGFSLVRDVHWDRAANTLIAPPVPEYSKLRAALLVDEAAKQLNHTGLWTLPIAGTAGSTVEIRLNVPMPADGATAANGSRTGVLSVTNRFAPPWRNTTTTSMARFVILPDEKHVDVLIYVDRVVVEAFAMGGRAAVLANEFRPDPQSTIHLFGPAASAPTTVHDVQVWEMGCGYEPLLQRADLTD